MSAANHEGPSPKLAPQSVHAALRQAGRPLEAPVTRDFRKMEAGSSFASLGHAFGSISLGKPGSPAEREAQAFSENLLEGRDLPARMRFDLTSVRIHADKAAAESARQIGARAYTVGPHIVFGEGQYRPETAQGRHVLAHELIHAGQSQYESSPTLHRYEAPEHQDFGDRGLADLADFLQTDEGKVFADQLSQPASLKGLSGDPFLMGKVFLVNGVRLTVGDIIAMAGDFYPDPTHLLNADPAELTEIRDAIQEERDGKLKGGKANERYQAITQKYIGLGKRDAKESFIGLAKVNAPHFTPTNRAAWKALHKQALKEARLAIKDAAKLDAALLRDTFGGHFLTDAFASGHLFDKQKLEAAIQFWQSTNTVTPSNPEMSAYYGIIGGNMGQLILKNIHDRLNSEGVEVSNKRGLKWKTYGDDHLKDGPDSLRIGALAVYESRQQILAANRGGPTESDSLDEDHSNEVLDLLPDDASVDMATKKAISYIPSAAAGVTSLIYRQRGAGALALKEQLGVAGSILAPIIKSNIATIADPGREKQLLDLERRSQQMNSGKLLAPQFTIFDFP